MGRCLKSSSIGSSCQLVGLRFSDDLGRPKATCGSLYACTKTNTVTNDSEDRRYPNCLVFGLWRIRVLAASFCWVRRQIFHCRLLRRWEPQWPFYSASRTTLHMTVGGKREKYGVASLIKVAFCRRNSLPTYTKATDVTRKNISNYLPSW